MTSPRTFRLALLAVLLLPRAAVAQGEVVDHEAESQFRLGLDAMKRGQVEEARVHFLESYSTDPKPGALRNLAVAESSLPDHKLDALKHLRQWLRLDTAKPGERARAGEVLRDLTAATGHITMEGASPRSSGVVFIDGKDAYGMDPQGDVVDVLPGRHSVVAKGAGGQTRELDLDAPAGATVTARFEAPVAAPVVVAPLPAPTPTTAPPTEPAPPPPSARPAAEAPPSSARVAWTAGLAIGAGALVAGGAVMGALSKSSTSHADAVRSSLPPGACQSTTVAGCSDLHSSLDRGSTEHTASVVLYPLGGAAAVAAALTWFLWPRDTREGIVAPLVGAGAVGAQWVKTF